EDEILMGYSGNLLMEAFHADPHSFGGRRALLNILESAGQLSGNCDRPDQYETIIALGEPGFSDLAADSATIHALLAKAYADVQSMAMGQNATALFMGQMSERYEGFPVEKNGVSMDLGPIRSRLPDARRKGYAHARAALATLNASVHKAAMWHLMFRMVA